MVNNAQQITQVNVTPGGAYGGVYREDCPSPARPVGSMAATWALINWPDQNNYALTIDFSAIVQSGVVRGIQSAYIDNTQCGIGVILQDCSGSKFTIPAGWQGVLEVSYIQNGQMYLAPDCDAATMTKIIAGNAAGVMPGYIFQTVINFYGFRQETKVWKGKGNAAAVLIGHSTPTIGEFDVFYDQWQGSVGGNGPSHSVELTPTFLNRMTYNSYEVTEITAAFCTASFVGTSTIFTPLLNIGSGNVSFPAGIFAQLILGSNNPGVAAAGNFQFQRSECGLYVGPMNDSGLAQSSLVAWLDATVGAVTGGSIYLTTKGYLFQ